MYLRWFFDGSSMVVRRIFEGTWWFFPFFLQSLLAAPPRGLPPSAHQSAPYYRDGHRVCAPLPNLLPAGGEREKPSVAVSRRAPQPGISGSPVGEVGRNC